MTDLEELTPAGELDVKESPVERVGRCAIGLWRATEELGDARLLETLRPFIEAVGFALARDLMSPTEDSGAEH